MKQNRKRQAGAKADSSTKDEQLQSVRRHNTNTSVVRCFTACCNACKWEGSQYKLLNTLKGFYCPKCNSDDVIVFGKPQAKTPETISKEFADWIRHALTNVEFCQKTIDEHYAFFVSEFCQK